MRALSIAALFFISFAVFLYTLHPTVSPYRDSGDLAVASATFGIAHPPGYPLYILSGKTATLLIPWGNIAYRMNVLSALFGAGALVFVALTLGMLLPGSLLPFFSLLVLAFSPAYWRLSQVSEMYSFNAFLAGILLYSAARMYYGRSAPDAKSLPLLYAVGFFCGLASGNHQTIVFLYPGLLLLLYGGRYAARDILNAFAFFFLGLSVYLFLPVRASTRPLSNWGDPENLGRLLRLMTRSDYGGMRLHPEQSKFEWSLLSLLGHLGVYVRSLGQQFGWLATATGALGIVTLKKDRYYYFLLAGLLLSGPFFIILSNLPPAEKTTLPILEPHLVLPGIMFAVFIAAGARGLLAWKPGGAVVAALVLWSFFSHRLLCDYRGHFFAYDYGRNILASMEKGGIIYDPDDPTAFITSYLQVAEGKRPDVRLAAFFRTRWGYEQLRRRSPDLLPEREIVSGQELALALLDHNRGRYGVYAELPAKFPQGYLSYPRGLMSRLSRGGENLPSGAPFALYAQRGPLRQEAHFDFFTDQIISYYAAAHNNIGLSYAQQRMFDAAGKEYAWALAIEPDLMAAHNNLGTLAFARGRYGEAERSFRKIVGKEPDNPSALYNLGLALKVQGKLTEAAAIFRRAWENNRYPDAGNELGLLALSGGDAPAAVALFAEIVKRSPGYLAAYYNLGLALSRTGDYAQSRRAFEVYLRNVGDPRERDEVVALLQKLPR